MPYNIKQLGEKSVSIDFFIADPIIAGLPRKQKVHQGANGGGDRIFQLKILDPHFK